MAGATLTTEDQILKDFYEGAVREELRNLTLALNKIEMSNRPFTGRQVLFPIHANRSFAYGWVAENAAVPAAQNESTTDAKILAKYIYGHVAFSGQVLEATKDDKGAFIEESKFAMEAMVRSIRRHCNIMFWGDGTGTLASYTAGDVAWSTGGGITDVNLNNTRFLRAGQSIDIIHAGVKQSTATLTSINSTTGFTIGTATANYTPVSGDLIVNTGDFNNAPMGMLGIIDDGTNTATLQNISRASFPAFKSVRLANGGTNRTLTFDLMQQFEATIFANGGFYPDEYWCHDSAEREIINLGIGDVRFVPTQLLTGREVLKFNGRPVIVDPDCQLNRIFGINWSVLKRYELMPFKWIDRDGLILRIAGVGAGLVDQFEAFFGGFYNVGVEAPAFGCGQLADLSVTYPTFVLNN